MIHYFTGTGNSYFIASQLATSLNLSLHALKEGPVEDRDPVVGIVFPVYFGDAPDFVTDALEGLTFLKCTLFTGHPVRRVHFALYD